ncbi:adenylate/guanylate cyclase domain-containing protein [Jeotgalibacillus haloalkalitolerans]|uniref:Adenylate/guanylate cyclase domain-containing protein n=1 Tax=Jeotgalibacillus haloalkalitolerans TaxID=3104292 RepID=A0ABU5KQA2_9BACL|nr:adenylate/guanylate cyclase domain-containing protein [Jeotgalibacillus sp. HH7-29]MDZ5713327.1 adenylate/guanylate cyclase domain-containing protein [Jeotgalibacillus sp. HH7-29]
MKEKLYVFKRDYPIPRQKAWDLLADTEHLNRVSGLFPVDFSDSAFEDQKLFRYAKAKAFGLVPLKWREHPFEWVKEEVYSVERRYESGPIRLLLWEVALEDSETRLADGSYGTRVTGTARFTPANVLGHAAIPLAGLKSIKEIMKYLDKYIESNHHSGYDTMPVKSPPEIDQGRMNKIADKLLSLHPYPEQVKQLCYHLQSAGDDEVLHMKPYVIADKWQFPRKEMLTLFLYAVKESLLMQEWHLMCPNCRVSKTTVSSMKEIKDQVHCDLCGVNYEMSFDQYIEMQFSVHPSVRKATDQTFCLTGPAKSSHVLAQRRISPGAQVKLQYPPAEGRTRVRLLKHNKVMEQGQSDNSQSYTFDGEHWNSPTAALSSSGGSLMIMNRSDEEIIVVYEKTDWNGQAVTAAEITSLQLFRDLFSSEVLSPDQQIGVQSMTVLFSDLKASTALYEKEGDAGAYHQVSEHFRYLKKHIKAHSGTVVKTIGDAVMAVFYREEDACLAALDIQDGIDQFNLEQQVQLSIKLGLTSGPVIAVNANDLLDYFGRTVNLAARIQQKSHGNDILMLSNDFDRVKSNLNSYQFDLTSETAELAGTVHMHQLIRLSRITKPAKREKEEIS